MASVTAAAPHGCGAARLSSKGGADARPRVQYLLPSCERKRQAALHRFGGIGAALADAQAGLLLDNKPALYQLGKAVGIFKIPEAPSHCCVKVLKVNGAMPGSRRRINSIKILYQAFFHE